MVHHVMKVNRVQHILYHHLADELVFFSGESLLITVLHS
jgi:hypothetical protein